FVDPRALHSFPTRRSSDLVEPVEPPYPPEIDAPYIMTVVVVVTVGAVHLKPQLIGDVVIDAVCVISPLITCVFDPAANVPADAPDRKSTRLNSSHVKISYA